MLENDDTSAYWLPGTGCELVRRPSLSTISLIFRGHYSVLGNLPLVFRGRNLIFSSERVAEAQHAESDSPPPTPEKS